MADLSWLTARPIAHRGLHDLNQTCWENTLAAFAAAIHHGYAIECDVHLAADRIPVVFHDDDLSRLTGHKGHVWQRTSGHLADLHIGGTSERIASLAAVLELVRGRVPLVIELKGIPGQDSGLVAETLSCLISYSGPVALMSFDHHLIRDLARLAPKIPYGLTAEGSSRASQEKHFSMLAYGLSFISYRVNDLPNTFTTFTREKLLMPVISWVVRDGAAVKITERYADQMTFEGFMPSALS